MAFNAASQYCDTYLNIKIWIDTFIDLFIIYKSQT